VAGAIDLREAHSKSEQYRAAHPARLPQHIPLKTQGDSQMGIRQTFKKWAAYQQTVRELASLDNRQLNDLGIVRTDIQRIARDHVKGF
jgi:uncharacterized protein YjiS (DUF1127 family)